MTELPMSFGTAPALNAGRRAAESLHERVPGFFALAFGSWVLAAALLAVAAPLGGVATWSILFLGSFALLVAHWRRAALASVKANTEIGTSGVILAWATEWRSDHAAALVLLGATLGAVPMFAAPPGTAPGLAGAIFAIPALVMGGLALMAGGRAEARALCQGTLGLMIPAWLVVGATETAVLAVVLLTCCIAAGVTRVAHEG